MIHGPRSIMGHIQYILSKKVSEKYQDELNLRQMYFITNKGKKHGPYGSNNENPYSSDLPAKLSVSIVNENVLDQATDYVLSGGSDMSNDYTLPVTINAFGFYVSLFLLFKQFKSYRLAMLS